MPFTKTFNRTSMELKHASGTSDGDGWQAFNRTSMELKPRFDFDAVAG